MKILTALAIWAAAAALVDAGGEARAEAPCQYAKVAELPARLERNRVLLEAELNGHPVWFMVDTGATATVLFSKAAEEAGATVGTAAAKFQGIGGARYAASAHIGELKVGSAGIRNTSMLAFGTTRVGRLEGRPVIGLLGMNFLGAYDIEFDLAHNAVRLFKNVGCKSIGLAYWADTFGVSPLEGRTRNEASPELYVNVNGHRTLALLDSGAGLSTVTTVTARAAGVSPQQLDTATPIGGIGAGAIQSQVAVFDSFSIADETVNHPRIRVADLFQYNKRVEINTRIATSTMPNYGMILGADFIRSHRVLIANSQDKLYFTFNGGQIFSVVGPIRPAADPNADPSAPETDKASTTAAASAPAAEGTAPPTDTPAAAGRPQA